MEKTFVRVGGGTFEAEIGYEGDPERGDDKLRLTLVDHPDLAVEVEGYAIAKAQQALRKRIRSALQSGELPPPEQTSGNESPMELMGRISQAEEEIERMRDVLVMRATDWFVDLCDELGVALKYEEDFHVGFEKYDGRSDYTDSLFVVFRGYCFSDAPKNEQILMGAEKTGKANRTKRIANCGQSFLGLNPCCLEIKVDKLE